MTGTERASVRLALGMLRRSILGVRDIPHDVAWDVADCLRGAGMGDAAHRAREEYIRILLGAPTGERRRQLFRARLALYLRALLRAEAQVPRCWRCNGYGRWWDGDPANEIPWGVVTCPVCSGTGRAYAPCRPLWEIDR